MSEPFLKDRVVLHCGDCRDVLASLEENSIDSCVTDPPYHLMSIVKRFSGATEDDVNRHARTKKDIDQGDSLTRVRLAASWASSGMAATSPFVPNYGRKSIAF